MKPNVVMPAAFAARTDAETLASLREQGVVTGTLVLDETTLKEPEYGEEIIGTLTEEETQLFAAYREAHATLQELQRKVGAELLHRMGDAIAQQKEKEMFDNAPPIQDSEAKEFHRLMRKVEYLKAMFFWVIGEKYKAHDHILGVRTKRRIIKGRRKW